MPFILFVSAGHHLPIWTLRDEVVVVGEDDEEEENRAS